MKRPLAPESERALAAAVALAQDITPVADLDPTDFDNARARALWAAGLNALAAGRYGTDHVTSLLAELQRSGDAGLVGGLEGLVRLQDDATGFTGVKWHADEVRRMARLRRLQESLVRAATECEDGDADEILSELASMERGRSPALKTARDLVEATWLDIKARAAGERRSISSGYAGLDRHLGGFEMGSQYVLGARPKMGKSAFAMGTAIGAAKTSVAPTLFFSHEMSTLQLGRRMIAHEGRAPIGSLKCPNQSIHMERIQHGSRLAASLPISFFVGRANLRTISAVARRWRRSVGTDRALIVVDYLQLIDRGPSKRSTNDDVAQISRELKLLAIELDVALLLLSQLNRSLESRPNKRPILADLRDSGAIEQDADAVIFLYRPWVYDDSEPEDACEAIVAAAREADRGTIKLRFEPAFTRFANRETT